MRLFILAAAALVAVSGCGRSPAGTDDDFGPIADFTLTERNGQEVSLSNLKGKVWIASFVFTRCCGNCPQILGTLTRLHHTELRDKADVVLVSFTVDPKHDTPEVLQQHANKFGADPKRWLFLTGSQEDIYQLTVKSFGLGVEENTGEARKPGYEVTHSSRLVLVDRQGRKRGYFDARDPEKIDELTKKVAELLQERP